MRDESLAKNRCYQPYVTSLGIIENPGSLRPHLSRQHCRIIVVAAAIFMIAGCWLDPGRWRSYLVIGSIVLILFYPGRNILARTDKD